MKILGRRGGGEGAQPPALWKLRTRTLTHFQGPGTSRLRATDVRAVIGLPMILPPSLPSFFSSSSSFFPLSMCLLRASAQVTLVPSGL